MIAARQPPVYFPRTRRLYYADNQEYEEPLKVSDSNTIDDERLFAFAAGALDPDEAAAVELSLTNNPEQAASVARYQDVAAIVRADDGFAPPATALARAKAIFPPPVGEVAPDRLAAMRDAVRRVVAELTFDSGAGLAPALAGFRGGDASGRQLMFESDGTVIDLQMEPPGDVGARWRIQGQVEASATPEPEGLVVVLAPLTTGQAAVAVTTDPYGEFHVQAAPGQYTILVRVLDTLVELPNLVIG